MGALWFGWVVLGCAVPVSLLTAAGFVRSVHDWLEPTGFAHVMAVMGLALAIFGRRRARSQWRRARASRASLLLWLAAPPRASLPRKCARCLLLT